MDIFKKRKFELLALTETKQKGNGEVSWCGVNGIIASVPEIERVKEGVAILLNDMWHSAVVDFGFKFSRVKVSMIVGYGPNRGGEERYRFWNVMNRTPENIGI